ncbi:hypothetical protein HZB89_02150 [archaeon]|nr:hypothetical protein [archaeon]
MKTKNMAVSPLIQSMLFLVTSMAIVGVVFQFGLPYIERLNDVKAFEEGKALIIEVDDVINKIKLNETTAKTLVVNITRGSLVIDDANDLVQYELAARPGIMDEGVFVEEGNIYLQRSGGKLLAGFQANDINVLTDQGVLRLSQGAYNLQISYVGTVNGLIQVRFRTSD